MAQDLSLLHKYASLFRKLINSSVWGSDKSIKTLLRLNSESDWNFLTAAMDIVDDASSAIHHIESYGLSGPTKYRDTGEKYLRLYGLLSATYIQQQAILTIFRIMNVPKPRDAVLRFDKLEIRSLRHKLSSHGTNYRNPTTGTIEAYVPLRFDLGDMKVTAVNQTGASHWEKVDLAKAIQSHIEAALDILDQILEKSIRTVFRGHDKKKNNFLNELADLRTEKAGGFVIKGNRGPKLVVTFVGTKTRRRSR